MDVSCAPHFLVIYSMFIPIIAAVIAVSLAFIFNYCLQKNLIKNKNKSQSIDMLMESLDKQKCFYCGYWESKEFSFQEGTNHTSLIKEFDILLSFVERKYGLNNMEDIREMHVQFRELSTGVPYGEKRGKDIIRAKKIRIIATKLRTKILENKI